MSRRVGLRYQQILGVKVAVKTAFFSSGFEPGDFSEYTHTVRSPTIETIIIHDGSKSMKATDDLFYSCGVDKTLAGLLPDLYYIQGYVRIDALTLPVDGKVMLLGESQALGFGPYGDLGIYFAVRNVAGVFKLILWDDYNFTWYNTGLTLALATWYKIKLVITRAAAPNGEVKLYVDDVLYATASATRTNFDGVWAGAGGAQGSTGQGSITMYVDTIEVSDP